MRIPLGLFWFSAAVSLLVFPLVVSALGMEGTVAAESDCNLAPVVDSNRLWAGGAEFCRVGGSLALGNELHEVAAMGAVQPVQYQNGMLPMPSLNAQIGGSPTAARTSPLRPLGGKNSFTRVRPPWQLA